MSEAARTEASPRIYQIARSRDEAGWQQGLTGNPHPPGLPRGEPAANARAGGLDLTVSVREPAPATDPRSRLAKLVRYGRKLFELIRRPAVSMQMPLHIQLESTDACNLHCTSCSRDMIVHKAHQLQEHQWKKVIDEIRPTNINVSGIGEPFLHPRILEIVRYARSAGAAVNCATNFTRVKGRHRDIVEAGFSQLKISIDAAEAETYRRIRGEDYHAEILANIREVNRWKRELDSTGPSLRFNFALQQLNFLEAPALVDLAAEHGVDGIYFQYLSYTDMEDRKEWLTGEMTREALYASLREAERRARRRGVNTNLRIWWRDFDLLWNNMQPLDRWQPNRKACYFPWMSTWIGADGWVRPCPIMPWTLDEGRMGHVDEQSFAEIWNNPKYRELRSALARGERPTRSCKLCYPQDLYNIVLLKAKLLP